jgi:hypothetical protein
MRVVQEDIAGNGAGEGMNVLERDKLRRIIELASELLKSDTASYAIDSHDDVKPEWVRRVTEAERRTNLLGTLGPHYDRR